MMMTSQGSDGLGNFDLEFKPAFLGSGVVGWDFRPGNPLGGEGRIELEYTRRSNQLDKVTFAEGSFKGGGDVSVDSLLLNFYGAYRSNQSPWAPYAGLGVGAARMKASGLTVAGNPLGSGTSTVFAYQVGTGVELVVTDHISLDLGYRFFSSIRPSFTEVSGRTFKMDYFSHNAVFGVRYGF